MINLNSIVQDAQGGQALESLAARFGLPPEQARSAVEALLPALRMGLQDRVGEGGLGALVGGAADIHRDSFADPNAATSAQAEQHGRTVLGGLFGGAGGTAAVAQQASLQSGVPASIIQAMLPVIASMLIGGLLKQAGGGIVGGLGGVLSSVLGSLLGQGAQHAAPQQVPPASPGGAVGDILGGGGAHPSPSSRHTGPAPSVDPAPPSAYATLDEISAMITAGTPPAPDHEDALAKLLRRQD